MDTFKILRPNVVNKRDQLNRNNYIHDDKINQTNCKRLLIIIFIDDAVQSYVSK